MGRFTCSLVLVFIMMGCSNSPNSLQQSPSSTLPAVGSTVVNGQVYMRAKAEFDISSTPSGTSSRLVSKSRATCNHGQCTDWTNITVTNTGTTQFSLIQSQSEQSLPQENANNNVLSSIVNLQVGTLFDNNLISCGGSKCTGAQITIYTTDDNGTIGGAGLYDSVSQQSINLMVTSPNTQALPTTTAVPYVTATNGGTSLVIDSEAIPQSQQVIQLADPDFADSNLTADPSGGYNLSADFTQAGTGTFTSHVVVEYDLIGNVRNPQLNEVAMISSYQQWPVYDCEIVAITQTCSTRSGRTTCSNTGEKFYELSNEPNSTSCSATATTLTAENGGCVDGNGIYLTQNGTNVSACPSPPTVTNGQSVSGTRWSYEAETDTDSSGTEADPSSFAQIGTNLFFVADSSTGTNVWVTNLLNNTTQVVDSSIYVSVVYNQPWVMNGNYCTIGANPAVDTYDAIYCFNGTNFSETKWGDDGVMDLEHYTPYLIQATNGTVYLNGLDYNTSTGYFYSFNGTNYQQIIASPATSSAGNVTSTSSISANLDQYTFFMGSNTDWGDLWVTDGTSAGTYDLSLQNSSLKGVEQICSLNGTVYVISTGSSSGGESGFISTINSSLQVSVVSDIGFYMDNVVCTSHDIYISGTNGLYVATTTNPQLTQIYSAGELDASPVPILNDQVVFSASGNVYIGSASGVIQTSITGTTPEISTTGNSSSEGINPTPIIYNNRAFFVGSQSSGDYLFATDGTAAGTVEVITNTQVDPYYANMYVSPTGNGIFLGGIDPANGTELFKYTE